jgi:CubicO group peptidase (beta-lactamase class C family)
VRVVESVPSAPGSDAAPADVPDPDPDAVDPATDGDLGGVLTRWQDRYSSSSLIVGVARPGVWEWTGTPYGGSGEGTFDIESITKTVTASAVWLLAADGVLTIDAPVPPLEALPELTGRGITVRQLLEHTSGIPDYHTLETPEDVGENPAVTVARNALAVEPAFAPGAGRDYSSTNYLILGLLVEERTGRPLDDVLWSRVLEPAGVGELFGRAGASVYLPGGGAGGLVTDARGLLAWGAALLRDHRPVGEGIWAGLTRLDAGTGLGAGLMGMCPCTPGFTWIGHTGGTTALFYDRASDVLVAVRIANGIWGGFEDPFAELMADLRTAARAA